MKVYGGGFSCVEDDNYITGGLFSEDCSRREKKVLTKAAAIDRAARASGR